MSFWEGEEKIMHFQTDSCHRLPFHATLHVRKQPVSFKGKCVGVGRVLVSGKGRHRQALSM